jgi:aspartyl protease family protein
MDRDLPRSLKLLTLWLLLGAAVFVGAQWWQRQAEQARFETRGGAVEIRRSADGHYHWPGRINGRVVDFLVDTGATSTAIPTTLARELGLQEIEAVRSSTAGGVVTGQLVRADLELRGGVSVERARMVALPGLGAGPLLGMDVLGKLHWQQRDGVLRIELTAPR